MGILVTPLVCVCVGGAGVGGQPQLDYSKIFNYMFYILILFLTFVFFNINIDNKKNQRKNRIFLQNNKSDDLLLNFGFYYPIVIIS